MSKEVTMTFTPEEWGNIRSAVSTMKEKADRTAVSLGDLMDKINRGSL